MVQRPLGTEDGNVDLILPGDLIIDNHVQYPGDPAECGIVISLSQAHAAVLWCWRGFCPSENLRWLKLVQKGCD